MNDPFLFGRSPKQRIVGSEVAGRELVLYTDEPDGSIREHRYPHQHWLLAPKDMGEGWTKLEGALHYGWQRSFGSRQALWDFKNRFRGQDFYQVYDEREAAMAWRGYTYYKGLNPKDVSVLSFDIETTSLDHGPQAKVLIISNTFRARGGRLERKLFCYDEHETEADLFRAWSSWLRECNPSVVVGHNIYDYDLPYLDYCASRHGHGLLALGRDGSPVRANRFESKFRKDQSNFYTYTGRSIFGREIVDTYFLAMKYDAASKKYENYTLKGIIKQEGLEVVGRQHYDGSKISANYKMADEWRKIKAYAMYDADDPLAIFDLMSAPFFYLARSVPKPFQNIINSASGSWLNSFLVRSYLQNGHSIPKADDAIEYPGAISLGNPGVYKNVYKVDVASLYPSLILQHLIYNQAKDPDGHFLKMVNTFTKERLANKKRAKETGDRYYKDLSEAQKIVINSAYGMLGAPGLNFNSGKDAALVTEKGREVLTDAMNYARGAKLPLVNADTDSISVASSGGEPWRPEQKQWLLDDLNKVSPGMIRWEDDGTYDRVLVLKIKNYVLERNGKRTIKGSALKATTKEPALRAFINEVIDALLREHADAIHGIYQRYVRQILELTDIKPWASKKTVSQRVLESSRTNEARVRDAIEGSDARAGDKVYVYFTSAGVLKLSQNWQRDHDPARLLKKLWDTAQTFETLYPTKTLTKYHLKKNYSNLLQKFAITCTIKTGEGLSDGFQDGNQIQKSGLDCNSNVRNPALVGGQTGSQ